MRWPPRWKERSWEDRAWYALLIGNVLALAYLVIRAPSADAAWVYRVTIWVDAAALVWWLGRSVQALVVRGGRRGGDRAGAGETRVDGDPD